MSNTQTMERPTALVETPPAPQGNVTVLPPLGAPKAYPPKIARALLAVTREIGAVGKEGRNTFHNYNYQKWEDVLNVISPLLTSNGLIIQQSEIERSLFENDQMMSITYCFTIINDDGDAWPDRPVWTAIARAKDQKGIPDDKAANKAHTQAHKYFLLHLFKIKTADAVEDDADATPKAAAKPPKPGSAEAKAADAPQTVPTNGHSADEWVTGFLTAIEGKSVEERLAWRTANATTIAKLDAPQFAKEKGRLLEAFGEIAPAAFGNGNGNGNGKPKPPKPGVKPAVPDPHINAPGWLAWLTASMKGFPSYEEGERFWNEKVQAMNLPAAVAEEANGVWQQFEERF